MPKREYARFKTEGEFLKAVLRSLPFDVYPRVTAIGGRKIHPDIDILQIKRISQHQYRLIGYELKLIKFDKRSKGLSWNAFYTGIGQALLYLKNGVHQAFLLLGFHENISTDEFIDTFRDWLWKYKELIARIVSNYISIGIYLYERGGISAIIEAFLDFYPSNKEIQLLSEELLQRKFTFDKRLKGEVK